MKYPPVDVGVVEWCRWGLSGWQAKIWIGQNFVFEGRLYRRKQDANLAAKKAREALKP